MNKSNSFLISIIFLLFSCAQESITIADNSDLYASRDSIDNYVAELDSENTIRYIVLHATQSSGDPSVEWFWNFFRNERMWQHAGYNLLIRKGGDLNYMQGWDFSTDKIHPRFVANGVKGINRYSLHVGIVGCYKNGEIIDTRTPEQLATLDVLLPLLKARYPQAIFLGHRDWWGYTVYKACPCFDLNAEYPYLNDNDELYERRIKEIKIMPR